MTNMDLAKYAGPVGPRVATAETKPPALPPIDLTRMNRKERRNLLRSKGMKIPGRNLPFTKDNHGNIYDYYQKRDEEINAELEARKQAAKAQK